MPDQTGRMMHIQSPLGETRCAVTALSGTERINEIYSFQVCVVAEDEPIFPEDILGAEVTVTIKYADLERPVSGIVASFEEIDPVGQNMFEYCLQIVPPLWLLGLSSHTRIFENMNTAEIVKQVISEACSLPVEVSISRAFGKRETCLQYNENDLEFVYRLLAEDGISFFFKHTKKGVRLVLNDSPTGFPYCSPVKYEYAERSNAEWRQVVSAFRRSGRLASQSLENFDYSEYAAPKALSFRERSTASSKLRQGTRQVHAGLYFERTGSSRTLTRGDCDERVKRWLGGMEADAEFYTGESAAPTLVAGHNMQLSDAPACNPGCTGFLLLEVVHSASEGLDEQATYSNRLRLAPADTKVAFRPAYTGSAPRIWGIQTATVVEVRPIPGKDVHAEVKVRFPWDEKGVSCWARVAQLYAGNKWGGYFVPELDQEVLVEFISGNPDRPVVVGAVYNSKNAIPPYNKWQSGIRTRSSNYNELLFTDEPGKEKFYTEAGKDHEFLVHNDQTGKVENNRSVEIAKNDALKVGGNLNTRVSGSKTLKVGGKSTLSSNEVAESVATKRVIDIGTDDKLKAGLNIAQEAGLDVKIEAGLNVVIKANMSITLEVGGSSIKIDQTGVTISSTLININGNAMTEVKAGGMLVLKGGVVAIN